MEPFHSSKLDQSCWQDRTKALEQQAIGRKGAGFNKVTGSNRSQTVDPNTRIHTGSRAFII